jgi:hypothetical protein
MFALTGGSRDDVRGYEHSVAVLLPRRRYVEKVGVLTALRKPVWK